MNIPRSTEMNNVATFDAAVIPADAAETAPDFVLADTAGRDVRLSDFRGRQHVVLVFNRGFT